MARVLCTESGENRYYSVERSNTVRDTEQLLETPLAHFEIRNLIKDEYDLSKFTMDRVAKLNDHPIIETAKNIFNNTHSCSGSGGLVLQLLGRVLTTVPSYKSENPSLRAKQKAFAECYETIDKAMYIHYHAVLDSPNVSNQETVNGDKLAILGGDYLFSFGIIRLASIVRRAQAFDFVGASIDGFCINQFISANKTWDQLSFSDWEKYGGYASAELLGYSAEFLVTQAEITSIRYEKAAYELGYNLKLKWNVSSFTQHHFIYVT